MKAYSTDLRERVIGAAKVFAISVSTIKRYLKQWRETGTLASKPIPGRPSQKLAPLQQKVDQLLSEAPDATLEQYCQAWEQQEGIKVSPSTMSRAIRRGGWTQKKRRWGRPNAMKQHATPGGSR